MTIPVLRCKNLITGEFCTIPSEAKYPNEVIDYMTDCIGNDLGRYSFGQYDFYVHETDSFKYCALLNEFKTNEKGKKSVIRYDQSDVESYCSSIERFAEENFKEIISYAHDIQYMIGTFVHKSIVNKYNENDIDKLRDALLEINTLAAIISAKDCFFRWRTGTYPSKLYSIDVKGKFYKIYKAFGHSGIASSKNITFDFDSDYDVPNIDTLEVFDFVPYLLIENAVKYSPNGYEIDISVKSGRDEIVCKVGSFGPTLFKDEANKVFDKNYRGQIARELGIKGEGLGLYHLKQAIDDLGLGSITVSQENEITLGGRSYSYTEFILLIPCTRC